MLIVQIFPLAPSSAEVRHHVVVDSHLGNDVVYFNRLVERIRQFRSFGMWKIAFWDSNPDTYRTPAQSRLAKKRYENKGFKIVKVGEISTAYRECEPGEACFSDQDHREWLPRVDGACLTVLAEGLDPRWFEEGEWVRECQSGAAGMQPEGNWGRWVIAHRCFVIIRCSDQNTDLPALEIFGPLLDPMEELPLSR
jgi:hypothetical protein